MERAKTGNDVGSPADERAIVISQEDAQFLCDLGQARTGIRLDHKMELIHTRVLQHLQRLGLTSFADYCDLLRANDASELDAFANSLTTNLTYFFREAHHFDHLREQVFPEFRRRQGEERSLRFWSAGCSTGEEAYSLAMVLRESFPDLEDWDAGIFATDIDSSVLARARRGVYGLEAARGLDEDRKSRWTLRGRGAREGQVRVRAELRDLVSFAQLNLMEDWPPLGAFDAVFCRNVLIYFQKAAQSRLVERFAELIRPGGCLFLGHSESVPGIERFFEPLGQTRFRRKPLR